MSNRRKIKHVPSVMEQAEAVMDSALKAEAQRRYDAATREWRAAMELEQAAQRVALENADYLRSLGLVVRGPNNEPVIGDDGLMIPLDFPAESLDALKMSMATDLIGPKMPRLDTYMNKFGM